MGLYDLLRCEYDLPGPRPPSGVFQTKSLERGLQEYTLTADGRLLWHYTYFEPVPEEERPNWGTPEWDKPLGKLAGAQRPVHRGDVELPYHGDIYFYETLEQPDGQRQWLEYQARFTHGRVEWVRRLEKPAETAELPGAHTSRYFDEQAIGQALHEQLHALCRRLPSDFKPYGDREREGNDCSFGCRHFFKLLGELGFDWGVCLNSRSPRAGLLTFEHQGCEMYEFGAEPPDPDD